MRQLPSTTVGLLEELEAEYPPKCKDPAESLEVHAQYAGKVALIGLIRDRYTANVKRDTKELPKVL